jgi:acetolactate synthase-1/2/3 large subunit
MNVSDHIVEFFLNKGIEDFFGYQGTMIVFLVDAIHRNPRAHNHSCYNEQGAAFAACGYAQATGHCSMAYATSGPGAINLLNGVADAWSDSKPVIFITGQINTHEYLNIKGIRQQGFQEIDVVSMAKPITKYCTQITKAEDVRYEFEKAWYIANEGRRGPVLLDLPMDVQRVVIDDWNSLRSYTPEAQEEIASVDIEWLHSEIKNSKKPLLMVGNGVDNSRYAQLRKFVEVNDLPVVTTLLAKKFLPADHPLNFGVVGGAYGHRSANMLVYKTDLLVVLGASMCTRQTGTRRKEFAPNAKIIRFDIDSQQLKIHIQDSEQNIVADVNDLIDYLGRSRITSDITQWVEYGQKIRQEYKVFDDSCEERIPNNHIQTISRILPDDISVVSDVGQHMMWIGQSFNLKSKQRLLFSGGLGSMGYSIPAAIGAYYATRRPAVAICGDGSFQMNIQELQWIVREQLPIAIIVLNNHCLGMIRCNQSDFIDGRYEGSCEGYNYSPCNIVGIAKAYGIESYATNEENQLQDLLSDVTKPILIELPLNRDTVAAPKTYFGEPMWNQQPYFKK